MFAFLFLLLTSIIEGTPCINRKDMGHFYTNKVPCASLTLPSNLYPNSNVFRSPLNVTVKTNKIHLDDEICFSGNHQIRSIYMCTSRIPYHVEVNQGTDGFFKEEEGRIYQINSKDLPVKSVEGIGFFSNVSRPKTECKPMCHYGKHIWLFMFFFLFNIMK